jgi:hypothetical protein
MILHNNCAYFILLSSEEEMVLPERKEYQMKSIKVVSRFNRVEADAEFKAEGVVAFEMASFEVNFFGNIQTIEEDTKIMADGTQIVINGNGFIPAGYEVK